MIELCLNVFTSKLIILSHLKKIIQGSMPLDLHNFYVKHERLLFKDKTYTQIQYIAPFFKNFFLASAPLR